MAITAYAPQIAEALIIETRAGGSHTMKTQAIKTVLGHPVKLLRAAVEVMAKAQEASATAHKNLPHIHIA